MNEQQLLEAFNSFSPDENTDEDPTINLFNAFNENEEKVEPSDLRKFQYGFAKNTTLGREVWEIGKASWNWATDDEDFKGELKRLEDERLEELYRDYPEFSTGEYDNDAYVIAGETSLDLVDPTTLLIPFGVLGKAAKVGTTAAKLKATSSGAVMAGTAATTRQLTHEQEVDPIVTGVTAATGGFMSGALFPWLSKKLGAKNRLEQQATDLVDKALIKETYGVSDAQLHSLEKIITEDKGIREIWGRIQGTPSLINLKRKLDIEKELANPSDKIKPQTQIGKTGAVTNSSGTQKVRDEIWQWMKDQAEPRSELIEKLAEKLQKEGHLSDRMISYITDNTVRPLLYGGMAHGSWLLVADANDWDEETVGWGAFMAGAVTGAVHKRMLKNQYIPEATAKKFSYQMAKHVMSKTLRSLDLHLGSWTNNSKLLAMGEPTAKFAKLIHHQFGSDPGTTNISSVQERSDYYTGLWMRMLQDVVKDVPEESRINAVRLIRGYGNPNDEVSVEVANKLKNAITFYKDYVEEVGFELTDVLDNYFPRMWDFNKIHKNKADFGLILEQALEITHPKWSRERIAKAVYGEGQKKGLLYSMADGEFEAIFDVKKLTDPSRTQYDYLQSMDIKLPLLKHIEEDRMIKAPKGQEARLERILEPYLINDPDAVLFQVMSDSVRSVEMARTFGSDLIGVKEVIRQIRKKYDPVREAPGMMTSQERQEIRRVLNTINAHFGRYGTSIADNHKWLANTALTLSTISNVMNMQLVAVANLGDLIQPIQNSKSIVTALKNFPVFGRTTGRAKNDVFARNLSYAEEKSLREELIQHFGFSGQGGDKYAEALMAGNRWFFKINGLEGVTSLSRRYAFNTGMEDTWKQSRRLFNSGPGKPLSDKKKSELTEYLASMGYKDSDMEYVSKFGSFDAAFSDSRARMIMEKAGFKAAERDAKIPTVGNRLLFTQTKNEWVKLLGQYSSWMQAKSAQMNSLIERMEDGDMKLAIKYMTLLSAYGGMHELRTYFTNGEFTEDSKNFDKWLSKSLDFSGSKGWAPSLLTSQVSYKFDKPTLLFPFPFVDSVDKVARTIKGVDIDDVADNEWQRLFKDIGGQIGKSYYQGLIGEALRKYAGFDTGHYIDRDAPSDYEDVRKELNSRGE